MDFMAGGELFLKLGMEGHFLEPCAAFYLAEMTLALEHLHSINVLHRDLKPENILLGSDGHCCLTDFGLAKDSSGNENEDQLARTLCGTMEYMAPEMVARKWYGKGADYWSLGCIAYEMLSGEPPFSTKKGSKELFKLIIQSRIKMPDGASAPACKLLKGLLNRDAGKRLGSSRGNMFEVGGVGALKQQPFFSGLDFGKLELKEIEPPEDFSVDNDEDLRHFHEEFTNMNLPRSVKELSKLDFLPKRCASDNFRGFSFIGDQFQLPERTASEQENYWNCTDEDGQSLSECASSVFDEDLKETAEPEPVPEKKKRPPRKKKKKKQQVPLETTDEGREGKKEHSTADASEKSENATVQTSNESRREQPSSKTTKDVQKLPQAAALNPNAKAWSTNGDTTNTIKPRPVEQSNQPPKSTASKPAPAQSSWASMNSGEPTSTNQKQAPSIPTKPAAQSNKWATVSKTKPPAYSQKTKNGWSTVESSNNKQASNGLSTTGKPTTASRPSQLIQPSVAQFQRTGSGSSDWTSHAMLPQSAVRGTAIPPPPLAQAPGPNAWPSLGDFPPPPGSKSDVTPVATSIGWGVNTQTKPSAWGASVK